MSERDRAHWHLLVVEDGLDITRPFDFEELLARIRASLRH